MSLLQRAYSVIFAAMMTPGNFPMHVVHDESGIDCMVLCILLQNAGCLNSGRLDCTDLFCLYCSNLVILLLGISEANL